MLPNDVPETLMVLIGQIADKPYLKNYQSLKTTFGYNCPITKKAADIFISEHIDQLTLVGKVLHDLISCTEVDEKPRQDPTTRQSGQDSQ